MSDQRFEAAKAAMQGLLSANPDDDMPTPMATWAVRYADALLAELARTAPQPEQAAPQGSAPDALPLARLEAAEKVCYYLSTRDKYSFINVQPLLEKWYAVKTAHEAKP